MSTYDEKAQSVLRLWDKDPKKALASFTDDPYSPVAQAFLTVFRKKYGIDAGWALAEQAIKINRDLAVLFYTLIGHRCFDQGNLPGMRLAYEKVELLTLNHAGASQKWLFSAYFYGARHEREMDRKLEYVGKALNSVKFSWAVSANLIETKLIRLYLWLRVVRPKSELIVRAHEIIEMMCNRGLMGRKRWMELVNEKVADSQQRFKVECTPGTNSPGIGNP